MKAKKNDKNEGFDLALIRDDDENNQFEITSEKVISRIFLLRARKPIRTRRMRAHPANWWIEFTVFFISQPRLGEGFRLSVAFSTAH